jgi:predicted lactoylglutathione lyase
LWDKEVRLPVSDLPKATTIYAGALGASKSPQFSDETASCMVFSETIFVMLLTHAKWAQFTQKPIVDAHRASEVAVALSADSREAVDKTTEAAGAHGGKVDVNLKQDLGFLYSRTFADLDGHVWESVYVDMAQAPKGG